MTAKVEEQRRGPITWGASGRAAEDPADFDLSDRTLFRTVTVKEGDTLRDLALEVYGRGDDNTLDMLKQTNPEIDDVDMIIVGQRIAFPPLSEPANRSRPSD